MRGALFYGIFWGVIGIAEPFINVHFLRLGFSGQQIGWLSAVFPFFNFVVAPAVARLGDQLNRRILLLSLSLAGAGAALIFFPMATTFLTVLIAYCLVMAFRSPTVTLADSLIARMADRYQLDFGHMRLWGSVIFTLTATGLGVVWHQTGFAVMFIACGLSFSLIVGAAQLLEEEKHPHVAPAPSLMETSTPVPAKRARVIPEAGILCLLAANFMAVGAFFMSANFGTVYMSLIGGTEMYLGALFGLSALGEVPGMLFGRRISYRLGDTNTLLIAYAMLMMGYIGYSFSTTPLVMLGFGMIRGLGNGLFLVMTITVLNHRAPSHLYATYQGLSNSLCWGLAPLLGGPISGYLYQALGAPNLFLINAAMTALAGLILLPTYHFWRKPPLRISTSTGQSL